MTANIKVALLLHFYQPWWQFKHILAQINSECYRPIFRWLAGRSQFSFSANINWSLLEMMSQHGYQDDLALMREVVGQNRIELFGTAAHHPILPLISENETQRQIERDRAGKLSLGLPGRTCGGFYLPEYAFSPKAARRIKDAGYAYTVADDAPFAARHGFAPHDFVPRSNDLAVFLRSRHWGNALSQGQYDFDRFNREFTRDIGTWFGGRPGYVVLATDAETFGHHHKKLWDWLLKPMIEAWTSEDSPVEIVPFEQLLNLFGREQREFEMPSGSWSTEIDDFYRGNYFPLWNSPGNACHRALWDLVNVARAASQTSPSDDALKMLSSCAWWQVSGRPNFNPQFMMFGALKAMEVIEASANETLKQTGRQAFREILNTTGMKA